MKKLTVTLFLAFLTVCASPVMRADDPRDLRLLWEEEGPYPDGDWGEYYCCIGDQNGDGCDDILYTTDRYFPNGDTLTSWLNADNRVNLRFCYMGMRGNPDMRIGPYHDYESMGRKISFIGDLIGDGPNVFGISSFIFSEDFQPSDIVYKTYIYLGGDDLDSIPDFTLTHFDSTQRSWSRLVPSNDHPCDINGDGYNDLLIHYYLMGAGRFLRVYYGGADFDTIPDFQLYNGSNNSQPREFSGYDLNNDGYDDLLLHDFHTHRFYFGGSPPDTIPDLVIYDNQFATEERQYEITYITMVPDINGDGYDDWTIGMFFGGWDYGEAEWLFLGGDSLTLEPFRQLEPAEFPHGAGIAKGGDVNGDGLNDLIVTSRYFGVHDLRVYLGSPWVDEEPVYAITAMPDEIPSLANMWMANNAHGDFNGDGVADFFLNAGGGYGSEMNRKLAIYLGNPHWHLGVADDEAHQPPAKLSMSVSPNPFNSTTTIRYTAPPLSDCELTILDISGREIALADVSAGDGVYPWTAPESGVYIVRLTSGDRQATRKLVCVK